MAAPKATAYPMRLLVRTLPTLETSVAKQESSKKVVETGMPKRVSKSRTTGAASWR